MHRRGLSTGCKEACADRFSVFKERGLLRLRHSLPLGGWSRVGRKDLKAAGSEGLGWAKESEEELENGTGGGGVEVEMEMIDDVDDEEHVERLVLAMLRVTSLTP